MGNVNNQKDDLDREIGAKLALSLYDRQSTSVTGAVCHVLSCVLAWGAVDDVNYLYAAVYIFLVFLGRMYDMRSYLKAAKQQVEVTEAFARKWEIRYVIGTSFVATWMGALTFYSVYSHTYSAATFIAIGLSFGTLVSVIGRNFGSSILVDMVLFLGCIPMAGTMIYLGVEQRSIWLAATGVIFLPFLLLSRSMANYVREYASTSMRKSREYEMMAAKFDAAISNQPNGMIMFDTNTRVSVINPRAKRILGVDDGSDLKGSSVTELMQRVLRNKGYSEEEFTPIKNQIISVIEGREQKTLIKTREGRHLEFATNLAEKVGTEIAGDQYEGTVVIFEDVTDRIQSEEKVLQAARYDTLSKIPNRGYWNERVNEAVANLKPGENIAISVFDIDRFKLINDTMGHTAGDNAIRLVASKLHDIKDTRAIFGRYGGDEFVVAFPRLDRADDVTQIFDDVFNLVNSTYIVNGHSVDIKVSGGVYVHRKGDFNLEEAISKADTALRKVKKLPLQTWSFFTKEMEVEHTRTLALKAAIKDALATEALQVMYQPMYKPDGSSFDCCEALARWIHPTIGYVRPDDFIRVAEETGAILTVTRQILLRACMDCNSWPGETSVSVNLSALDLSHPEIVQIVRSCLSATGLPARRLQIEVTETVFVNDFENTARTLHILSNLGIRIALDDFGTGYSSLSYLNKLPLDKVKIDRSFIHNLGIDPQARLLFNGIVRLSKEMQFEIVVEGVETEEQLKLITQAEGVDRVQGYIFSRPEPTEIIIDKLNENNTLPPSSLGSSLINLNDYQRRKKKDL